MVWKEGLSIESYSISCSGVCQNVINLSVKLAELNGVPTSTLNVSTQQSWVSMQVNIFTSKPHMSAICHIVRFLRWKNIQWNE